MAVIPGTASCSFSATVTFAPSLSASGGGTRVSHVAGSLTNCTWHSGYVRTIFSGKLTGTLSSSPFACGASSQTSAQLTALIRWHGRWWPRGTLAQSAINGSSATGSFPGGAIVTFAVPSAISGGCTGGAIHSTTASGTIAIGPECGHVGDPVSVYVVNVPSSPICGVNNYMPTGITAGPDGALWFPVKNGSFLGRMTTTGQTTYFPTHDSQGNVPWGDGGITVGSDGALWFLAAPTIGRMTTDGQVTNYTLPAVATDTVALTAGPDGALWFAYDNASGNGIGSITTSGQVTTYTDPSLGTTSLNDPNFREMMGITAGPDGALWFAMFSDPAPPGVYSPVAPLSKSWIGRISTSGQVTTYLVPWPGVPRGLTTGPDGAIWFAGDPVCWRNSPVTNTYSCYGAIGRVTTAGAFTAFTSPTGQILHVSGMSVGPDGALWFVNYNLPGQGQPVASGDIGRITADGTITTYSGLPGCLGLTVGPDGAMWCAGHASDTLGRLAVP